MFKPHLLVAVLASSLIACGGGSGGSSDKSSTTAKNLPSYAELSSDKCPSATENTMFDGDVLISESRQQVKGEISVNAAALAVSSDSNAICLDGAIATATISENLNQIVVSGNIDTLTIDGSYNDIFIFGSVSNVLVNGEVNKVYIFNDTGYAMFSRSSAGNSLYYKQVGSYDDLSNDAFYNRVRPLSEAEL